MKQLKVKTSWLKRMESLSDAECGRLFRGMLMYASSGEVPSLSGNERIVWAVAVDEIDEQQELSAKRAEAGRLGGSKPKQTEANESKPKQTEANESKPKQIEANESKEKTTPLKPLLKENIKKTSPKGESKERSLSPALQDALKAFKEMRIRMRKPMTDLAVDLLIQRLAKMAPGDEQKQVAMLMQSIENGWTGVYELKQDVDLSRRNNTLLNYNEHGVVKEIHLDPSELDPDPPAKPRRKKRDYFSNYKEDGVEPVNLDDIALTLEDEL